tara:strand:- start:56 stop:1108 length:1053 start_codon:yes stop_codon:yes gene_type:complete
MGRKKTFRNETIDLDSFNTLEPRQQLNAKFVGFDWLDLDEIDVEDQDYFNFAVRDETVEEFRKRVDDISLAFDRSGFKTQYWPPCFGTDGKPRDGRGRIKAAIENGERWIPIAVYEYDDSLLNHVTNGILANLHDPASRPGKKDFIKAGVFLINSGQIQYTDTAISTWLYSQAKVREFLKGQHTYTQIINQIKDKVDNGEEALVDLRESGDWKAWILKNLGLVDRKDYILTAVNNVTYVNRTWCENILPAIKRNQTPVDIILYTKSASPDTARADVLKFVEAIHTHYETSYKMVNNNLIGMDLVTPPVEQRPYRFIGCCPQFYGLHCGVDKDGNTIVQDRLISIEKYTQK